MANDVRHAGGIGIRRPGVRVDQGPLSALDAAKPPVVVLSGIRWDFLWQRHQILATLFAQNGYPTVYVETTGLRNPSPDPETATKVLRRVFRSGGGGREAPGVASPNLVVYSHRRLPCAIPRALRRDGHRRGISLVHLRPRDPRAHTAPHTRREVDRCPSQSSRQGVLRLFARSPVRSGATRRLHAGASRGRKAAYATTGPPTTITGEEVSTTRSRNVISRCSGETKSGSTSTKT